MSMTVENLDYTKLMSQRRLLGDFRSSVCETLAAETGDSLTAKDIQLQLMPGSVHVVANVNTSVLQGPSRLNTSAILRARLVASISRVAGISTVSTGEISVVDLQAAPRPWAGFPDAHWFLHYGPMIAMFACLALLVPGVISVARRVSNFRASPNAGAAPSTIDWVEPPADKVRKANTGARAGGKAAQPKAKVKAKAKAKNGSKMRTVLQPKERGKEAFTGDPLYISSSSSSSDSSSSSSTSSHGSIDAGSVAVQARDQAPRNERMPKLRVPVPFGQEPEARAPPPRPPWESRQGRASSNLGRDRGRPRSASRSPARMTLQTIPESPASTPRVSPAVSRRNLPTSDSPRLADLEQQQP